MGYILEGRRLTAQGHALALPMCLCLRVNFFILQKCIDIIRLTVYNITYILFLERTNKMDYISVQEAVIKWGISERRIQKLCEENRIPGVIRFSRMWLIPKGATKPEDARRKKIIFLGTHETLLT
jgi:hypothetical protein